ncbi:uncharacterized protein LOC110979189 isoform X2 [Acanthaster planci]|nr:uncharacterized protein LOC110979189 isoform X2 [Acanthaster planci]
MPKSGWFYGLALLVFGFSCLNASEHAYHDSKKSLSECMFGPEDGGTSTFVKGNVTYPVCSPGKYFDNTTLKCTRCPPIHYMDGRNFCSRCKKCPVCSTENEEKIEACQKDSDTRCQTNATVPNITRNDETSILDPKIGLSSTPEGQVTPRHPPCFTPSHKPHPPLTLNPIHHGLRIDVFVLSTACIALAVAMLYLMIDRRKIRRNVGLRDERPQEPRMQQNNGEGNAFLNGRGPNDANDVV